MLLRADKNAQIVKLGFSLARLFTGRYTLASGKRTFDVRWHSSAHKEIMSRQRDHPVALFQLDARAYWMFQDCFFSEDDNLTAQDVKALVLQRTRRRERQLATAHSLMRAEEAGEAIRVPVPLDVRRAAFERDGGRCVECGGNFDLQYDHIIPLSLGGATSLKNIQLLCADCNREKGASM